MNQKSHARRICHATVAAPAAAITGNTTLSVVVTNQQLDRHLQIQVGRQIHSSMARAIQPFHTGQDGDTLFTVSTNEVTDPSFDITKLGTLASDLMWDAILASIDPES